MDNSNTQTYQIFLTFPPEEQEKLLSFIQGNSGLQITYDTAKGLS